MFNLPLYVKAASEKIDIMERSRPTKTENNDMDVVFCIEMLDVSVLHFTDYFAILTKGIKRSPRYLDGFRDLRITKRSPWGQGPNNLARGPRHFRVRGPPIRCILLCMSVLTIEANFLELLFGKLPTVIHLLMEIFLLLLHPLAQIVALRLRYQL